jgi:TP901 family phage tail tape measure protein
MAAISEILLVFGASAGGALAGIEEVRAGMGELGTSSDTLGSKLAGFAKLAAVAVGTGLAVAIGVSIKAATDFQKQMTMIVTQANQQGANLQQIGNSLLTMAPQVGASATQLAEVYYHFASAGMNVATALDATKAAAELAKTGNADYESTAQAVVAVLSAYPQYAGNAGSAVATLNAIVGTGDMRMQQLAKAMSTGILPAANTAKLSITDVGAALATLTDNATPADEAATRLRMTFALLQHQSNPAADALKSIGIQSGKLGEDMVKPNGLLVAVTDLRTHLAQTFGPQAIAQTNEYISIMRNQGVDAANKYAASVHGAAQVINDAFGGGRTSAAIQTLLGEYDKFSSKYAAIEQGTKNFQQDWETTKQNFSFQMDAMKAALDSLAIKIGQALLPMAGQVASWMSDNLFPVLARFADWFTNSGIPLLHEFASWIGLNVLPVLAVLASTFQYHIFPALVQTGQALVNDVINPLVAVARVVLPPILGALLLFADHTTLVKVALDAFIARWAIIKALDIATAVLAFAGAFRTMAGAEGIGAAVQAVLGLDVTLGTGLIPTIKTAKDALLGLFAAGEAAPALEGAQQLTLALGGGAAAAGAGGGIAAVLGMGALFAAVAAAVVAAVIVMWKNWDTFKTYISGSFMAAMHGVLGFFQTFASYISGSFMGAVHSAQSGLDTFAGYISGSFQGAVGAVTGAVHSAIDSLGNFLGNAATELPSRLSLGMTSIHDDLVYIIPHFFGEMVGFVGAKLVQFGLTLLNFVAITMPRFVGGILTWIGHLPMRIVEITEGISASFRQWGAGLVVQAGRIGWSVLQDIAGFFEQLPGRTVAALNAVVGFFVALPGRVGGALSGVIGAIVAWGSQLVSTGSQSANNFVNTVTSKAQSLPGAFMRLAGDVLNGFLQGLKAGSADFFGAVGSFFMGVVDGVKKAMGISSPSRLFAEQVGAPIALGIAQGITDNLGAVQRSLGQLASVTATPLAAYGSMSGPGGSTVGTVIVNNPTSNVDVLTAISQQQWLARMQQRGVTPLAYPVTMVPA